MCDSGTCFDVCCVSLVLCSFVYSTFSLPNRGTSVQRHTAISYIPSLAVLRWPISSVALFRVQGLFYIVVCVQIDHKKLLSQTMRILPLPCLSLLAAMIASFHLPAIMQPPKHSPPVISKLSEIDGPEWPMSAALAIPIVVCTHPSNANKARLEYQRSP